MSNRGWTMRFVPQAVVYHTHPDTLSGYLRKKYKFAFWRVLALRKNPKKILHDSHTPQIMKFQLLFGPTLAVGMVSDFVFQTKLLATAFVCLAFLLSTVPFLWRALRKDFTVGLLSPALLATRSFAQFLGVSWGMIRFWKKQLRLIPHLQ